MNEYMMPIPSRIYNAAIGGHVAGADQIIDDKTGLTLDKVASGALEEKTYTSGSDNGMGRVVLRKNLVEGVNTLTQNMINKNNTIYVIQYDFTLDEDITIPKNCVFEFDGGSLSGAYTITGNNTGIIYKSLYFLNNDLSFKGTFDVQTIIANWFKAEDDAKMFNTALMFASNNIKNHQAGVEGYHIAWTNLTCINKKYTIDNYIYIPENVSFDGNGSMFIAGSGLDGLFMFYCNCKPNWSPEIWDSHTQYFRNIFFTNPSQYDVSVAFINDNRVVEDITTYFSNRLFVYSHYRDNRIIRNISRSIRRYANVFDNSTFETASKTAEIDLSLGDTAELNHIGDGVSIAINTVSDVKIIDCINISLFVGNNQNVFLKNIHNEYGSITIVGGSRVKISDSIIYYNIEAKIDNFRNPEIKLDNVIFGNLKSLYDNNIKLLDWHPIQGSATKKYKNVRGVLNLNHGGNIMIKDSSGYFINPNECIISESNEIIKDDISVPSKVKVNQWNEAYFYGYTGNVGTDAYIRLIALVDDKRFLYKQLPANLKYNTDLGIKFETRFEWATSDCSALLYGSLLRIEIGNESGQYTHYFDFGIVAKDIVNFVIFKDTNNNYVFSGGANALFSDIDYVAQYTPINWYERKGNNIKCSLTTNNLPDVSLYNEYDEVITLNGKVYHKLGNFWVDATGTQV